MTNQSGKSQTPIEPGDLQFRALFESAPGLYLVLKQDLTIVAVTDGYLQATMTRREEILGRHLFDVFPDNPDDASADGVSNLRASLRRVLEQGVSDTMAVQKYDVRRPEVDGGAFEERYWSPVNSPVFGPGKSIEYIIHRVEDVTEFVREKQQAGRESQLSNELRARMDKMEAEIFIRARELQEVNEQLRAANQELEKSNRERKEAEEKIQGLNTELRARAEELESSNRELEAFSYSVSHDLRAPLRHIQGFVDLLKRRDLKALDEKSLGYFNFISDSAKTMGVLIDDLLNFSRVGRTELRILRADLNLLVQEVIASLGRETDGRIVHWRIEPLPEIQGDVAMLKVVFVNLLSNAVKYTRTRPEAKIEIGCDSSGLQHVIYVRDNGVGFDMQYVDKLFGVFQRLHHTDQFEGTGIGLANVRRIVQRHQGRTWARAELDRGATFFASFPKMGETAPA